MIVEKVPSFLTSTSSLDTHEFDKNGRFIYVKGRNGQDPIPTFTVYDVIFNDYVKLFGDDSAIQLKDPEAYWFWFQCFSPTKTFGQLVATSRLEKTSTLILLIQLNFKQKSYGILDRVQIDDPQYKQDPALIRKDDEDTFGLFFGQERIGQDTDSPTYKLLMFSISDNKIQMNQEKEQYFNYHPVGHTFDIDSLYWHNDRIWFVCQKDDFPGTHSFPPSAKKSKKEEEDDEKDKENSRRDCHISYYDLTNTANTFLRPGEKIDVGTIEDIPTHNKNWLANIQWVHNFLFVQKGEAKLAAFDLLRKEWVKEDIDFGISITEVFEEEQEWTIFVKHTTRHVRWSEAMQINIDNNFVLMAVNVKTGNLHRVGLRSPLKLMDIVWTKELNQGRLNKKATKFLAYERVF